jgi:organic hydroperoxide reductase OsmC/OhrA
MKQHRYNIGVEWTGNLGNGTSHYAAYSRNYSIEAAGKPTILGSSDPTFRGDKTCYNPEELLVSTLSSCHMLWYLHLCATAGVVVTAYTDQPEGIMQEEADGSGRFVTVTLYPTVTVAESAMIAQAEHLHHRAHELCFIANSVNFPVSVVGQVQAPQ